MQSHCLRHDRLPGSSRLLRDYVYQFDKLAAFYTHAPYDPEALRQAAAAIAFPAERRAAIAAALETQNPGSTLLEQLRKPGTVVVATGQQVGYLGGPAYTIYKALTAIRVAESLCESGIPAVPLFWLASEDHDLAEVDHAWVFNGQRHPLRYQAEKGTESNSPVGSRLAPPLRRDELAAAFAHLPFGEQMVDLAAEAYSEGRTYTEAFRFIVERTLGRHRVLFLNPLDPAIRALSAPLLAKAVEGFSELSAQVHERTRELEAAGYDAQVHLESDSSFFFVLEDNERLNLKSRNGSFVNGKRSWSGADLAAIAAQVSPNALLRPVLQDYLLPTACLVGGPAEIAYLAQSAPLYAQLLGRQPVFLPRNGFTLIDDSAARQMDRYGLNLPEFFIPESEFEERLARTRIPSELIAKMESAVSHVSGHLDELRRDLLAFDPTLAAASERSHKRVLYQFQKLERKTAREIGRREERIRDDARYLRGLVYPEKHPQERLYAFLPFLAAHGTGLVDVIYESIHENCPDHHVLMV